GPGEDLYPAGGELRHASGVVARVPIPRVLPALDEDVPDAGVPGRLRSLGGGQAGVAEVPDPDVLRGGLSLIRKPHDFVVRESQSTRDSKRAVEAASALGD